MGTRLVFLFTVIFSVVSTMEFKGVPCSSFYGKRFETLACAEDVIENTKSINSEIDVVIILPDADYRTDEEEFDDDDLVTNVLPNDVPGELEIDIIGMEDPDDDNDEWQDDKNIPLSEFIERSNKRQKFTEPKWTQAPIEMKINSTNGAELRLQSVRDELLGLNAVQIFEKLFDDEVVQHIVYQTNLFASASNNHILNVSKK